jgi:hypothetical protein
MEAFHGMESRKEKAEVRRSFSERGSAASGGSGIVACRHRAGIALEKGPADRNCVSHQRMAVFARFAAARATMMAEYRIYTVGADGHFVNFRGFVCDHDEDALVWARQWMDGAAVEVWSGERFVTRLEPDKRD